MIEYFTLQRVQYMPRELEPGILYYSKEFGIAGHMCPCGCGNKIITPIGPTDWSMSIRKEKPTLYPSIGNWQIPCRSHYWITQGQVKWSYQWTEDQIEDGRKKEEKRLLKYFDNKIQENKSSIFKSLLNRLSRKRKKKK